MAKIELVCIGKQKFKDLEPLEKEYEKKISFFAKFIITIIKPVKSGNEKTAMKAEGNKILEKIKDNDILISLDRKGDILSSVEFSRFISNKLNYSDKNIVFAIGGPAGLSDDVLKNSAKVISFSKMTFAHDIFKILFLEQLYRAFTIIKRTGYHR